MNANENIIEMDKVDKGVDLTVRCETQSKRTSNFESQDYLPPHSQVYLKWLAGQAKRNNWDKWMMMGLIGVTTGVTGFFLHQLIDVIADTKWRIAKYYISQDKTEYAAAWITGLLYRNVELIHNNFNKVRKS